MIRWLVVFASVVGALESLTVVARVAAQETDYVLEQDILYREGDEVTAAMRQRCRLDVYYPQGLKEFPTIIWFHGGGLTGGEKSIPEGLKRAGVAVIAANYRLSPEVESPVYLEDAAAAVAWTFRNVERFGGSRQSIFVAGHSAGGYLTLMLGLDPRWLAAHDLDANQIAGLIPYSGQAITHFTIRKERGIAETRPVIDELAPLHHVRPDAPPLLLITGDREKELLGRYEENAYLWRMMKVVGHARTELVELAGYDHGGMAEPGHPKALEFVRRCLVDR